MTHYFDGIDLIRTLTVKIEKYFINIIYKCKNAKNENKHEDKNFKHII